jgi:hypothetical protein
MEKLEEHIADIKGDMDKYKGQGGQNDRVRKKLLKELEDRLATTEAKAEQYEAKSIKAAKTVSHLQQVLAAWSVCVCVCFCFAPVFALCLNPKP